MGTKLEKALLNAEMIINYFRAETDCFEADGKIKKVEFLYAVDDDPFSAYILAWAYHKHYQDWQTYPKVVLVGGFGILSKHMNVQKDAQGHQKVLSEAEVLEQVVLELGVSEVSIVEKFATTTNTGQNVLEYAKFLEAVVCKDAATIFCLTPRISGRFKLTALQQAPQLKAYYLVKDQPQSEAIAWYNGKILGKGRAYIAEAASIYDRYLKYTEPDKNGRQFMKKLPRELPQTVVNAGESLVKFSKAKASNFSLQKIFEYISMRWELARNMDKVRADRELMVRRWKEVLIRENLVSRK